MIFYQIYFYSLEGKTVKITKILIILGRKQANNLSPGRSHKAPNSENYYYKDLHIITYLKCSLL